MYISTTLWRDLTDGHLYREGDIFPFDGREIPETRLKELESGRNRAGLRLIQATGNAVEETEAPEEKAPEEATEAEKTASTGKPKRSRTRSK